MAHASCPVQCVVSAVVCAATVARVSHPAQTLHIYAYLSKKTHGQVLVIRGPGVKGSRVLLDQEKALGLHNLKSALDYRSGWLRTGS